MKKTRKIALIPAYMPDRMLSEIVMSLYTRCFDIVIVNDGSPKKFDHLFSLVRPYVSLVTLDEHKGKEEAVKTGLEYIRETFSIPYVVVCVDAGTSNCIEDAVRMSKKAMMERCAQISIISTISIKIFKT